MKVPTDSERYRRFGVFEVDLHTGELRRSGRRVALQGKPFQVLVLLLERPGELVTLDEFAEKLWPNVNVAFSENLRTAVRRLREVLGDDADVPRYIENLRDRGYRFIYPIVRPEKIATEDHPPRSTSVVQRIEDGLITRWQHYTRYELLRTFAVVLLPLIIWALFRYLTQADVVAVLPFLTPDLDGGAKAAAAGIANQVTMKLVDFAPRSRWPVRRTVAIVPHDEVVSRKIQTVSDAYRLLGANRVVLGKVDRSSGTERFLFTLTDGRTGHLLCAETLSETADPGALEGRVVAASAKCLGLVAASPPPAITDSRSPDAYKAYLVGRGYLLGYDIPDNVGRAVDAFALAVELSPKFALAHTGLGEAYWRQFKNLKDPALAKRAQQSCDRALQLDDNLAEAHACLGTLHNGIGAHAQALVEFRRVVQLDSRSDGGWRGLAEANAELGNLTEAENEYKKAISIRPYWGNYAALAEFYFYHAKYTQAVEQFRTAINMTPDNSALYVGLGGVYIAMGRYDAAIENLRQAIAQRPTYGAYMNLGTAFLSLGHFNEAIDAYGRAFKYEPRDHRTCGNLARATFWSGRREQARPLYLQAVNLADRELNVHPDDPNVHIDLAWYYAMLGQRPEALNHMVNAHALDSGKAEYAFIAAIVHNQFGERAGTLKCLRKAVELGFSTIELNAAPEFTHLHPDAEFQSTLLQHSNQQNLVSTRGAKSWAK